MTDDKPKTPPRTGGVCYDIAMTLPLTQSPAWEKMLMRAGNNVCVFDIKNKHIVGVSHTLVAGFTVMVFPQGPYVENPDELQGILPELVQQVKKNNPDCIALRIEPRTHQGSVDQVRTMIQEFNARQVRHVHPVYSRLLDLSLSEDQLLQQMRPKTRYNIHLSEKKGIVVNDETTGSGIDIFLQLTHSMSERQGIRHHADDYYRTMVEVLSTDARADMRVFVARYQDQPLAVALYVQCDGVGMYLHGASSDEYRNLKAPHAVQWTTIQHAKKMGMQVYDFFGENPTDQTHFAYRASWEGITRFKSGFGGEVIEYPGTFELPLRKIPYAVYRFVKKLK